MIKHRYLLLIGCLVTLILTSVTTVISEVNLKQTESLGIHTGDEFDFTLVDYYNEYHQFINAIHTTEVNLLYYAPTESQPTRFLEIEPGDSFIIKIVSDQINITNETGFNDTVLSSKYVKTMITSDSVDYSAEFDQPIGLSEWVVTTNWTHNREILEQVNNQNLTTSIVDLFDGFFNIANLTIDETSNIFSITYSWDVAIYNNDTYLDTTGKTLLSYEKSTGVIIEEKRNSTIISGTTDDDPSYESTLHQYFHIVRSDLYDGQFVYRSTFHDTNFTKLTGIVFTAILIPMIRNRNHKLI